MIAQDLPPAPLRRMASGILGLISAKGKGEDAARLHSAEAKDLLSSDEVDLANRLCSDAIERIERVIYGKQLQVKQALACLLAQGHLLLEDVPGVGKTTLAQSIAGSLGLENKRVQFTADMLPSDITGASIFEREQQKFVFHPGPVFTQLLLADEINRASPKTQSALLEAMAERQVSVDGHSMKLPTPFFVIATQNPLHQMGTFPLPESQVDRFLMSISMGYPDESAEMRMLIDGHPGARASSDAEQSAMGQDKLMALQALVARVHVSAEVAAYAYRVIAATRSGTTFVDGLSPRAGMAWIRAAKAWALLEGRAWVIPDDLQALFVECALHRLTPKLSGQGLRSEREASLRAWLKTILVDQADEIAARPA